MKTNEAISSLVSVRKYSNKEVSKGTIDGILNVARLAPSGNNVQPWHFYVLTGEQAKEKLGGMIYGGWLYEAPVVIVCATDPREYTQHKDGWDDPETIRAIRDMGIASDHLRLAAHDMGLGSCYCGWRKSDMIRDALDLEEQVIIPFVIGLGYPKSVTKPGSRKSLDEIRTFL